MRILQISSAQTLGGGERHLADLANGLAQRGHDLYLAVRPASPLLSELTDRARGNVSRLALRNSLDAKSARELAALVRRSRIEIIHAHMARDYPLAAYAARKNPDARFIVTRHVLFPLSRLHRVTLSHAARIIAVSQAVASQLSKDRIAASEKIRVVLNGIDVEKFMRVRRVFDRDQFLADWKLPDDSLLIGTVGELTPLKGQEEFLRAAVEASKQYPKAYFIIAGIDHSPDNKNHAHLARLIVELGLSDRVRLVGWLEDSSQLYCALDVFVSASHTESFGLAITEAMASGTAVVATETEGAREIIRAGETGLLVPIADVKRLAESIISLLSNKELRTKLGSAAQGSVSAQFSVERMVEETEQLYRSVIAEE